MESFGKTLVIVGLSVMVIGLIMMLGSKFGLGRLPGDVYYKKENFIFYFPIVTSIVVSIILSIILNILFRK